MTIPELGPENCRFHDELIGRAATELRNAEAAGGPEVVRARYAFLVVSGLLMADDMDIYDKNRFLPYLQAMYRQTTGEPLPLQADTDYEWQIQLATAATAFNFRAGPRKWNPNFEELAIAILEHDPRIEFRHD